MVDIYASIAELILKYKNANKKIDNAYAETIMNIIIETEDLYDFIKECSIHSDMNEQAFYHPIYKDLWINPKILEKNYWEPHFLSPEEKEFFPYFFFNESVFHELDHTAKQKMCFSNGETIEAQIIKRNNLQAESVYEYYNTRNWIKKLIANYRLIHSKKIYDKYYWLDPAERLATINSFRQNARVAEILNLKNIVLYEKLEELKYYIEYQMQESSTFFYLSKLGYKKECLEMDAKTRDLPLEERLLLGLHINKWEYEEIVDKEYDLSLNL